MLNFSGNIGGQMGLFIGASMITIFEFFEYFIMKGYVWWKERKVKKERTKAKQEEEDATDRQNEKEATSEDPEWTNGKKEKVAYV